MGTSVFILLGFLLYGLRAQLEPQPEPQVLPCKGGDSCCDNQLCGENEGDCDNDDQCAGNLKCGKDNCVGEGFDGTDDCCYEGGKEILNCEAILDAAQFIYHLTVWQKCASSPAAYPGIFDFSDNTCSPSSCVELVLLSPLCQNFPPATNCSAWEKTAQQLVNIATEYCSAGSNKKAVSKPLGRGECEAIARAQRVASYATVVQGCENPGSDISVQLQECSKLSCMADVFKQCSFCVEYSCGIYKRFTNMVKDLSKIEESHCETTETHPSLWG